MSFKEIKILRQSGRLEEALGLAIQGLESEPENIWNKRAAAWVYYDYIKLYSNNENFEEFLENLTKIKNLNLPDEEKMIFDNVAWQVGKLIFELKTKENVDYSKINCLFEVIKDFNFTKPSEEYTFIFKAFHKDYQNWPNYLDFSDWWDLSYLRAEDFLKEEFNGRKNMSVAEQAYIAYSKKLLEGEFVDPFNNQIEINREKIELFLPELDILIENHPEYQYPPYYKAKLLLALGEDENALSAFLPFARQKRNDFWVWVLLGEIFADDKKIKFSCYSKALSLKSPEEYLVKTREEFAEMLIENSLFIEAKTEIQKIIAIREKQDWKIPFKIVQWSNQDWYKNGEWKKDNTDLYLKNCKMAEEVLFQDLPEELIVVEFVNENKQMLNFVKNKQKFGYFNYAGQLEKPKIGDVILVRFNGEGENHYYKILTAKKADSNSNSEALKQFEGSLKVISPQNFGFIEDVFVDQKFIKDNKLKADETYKGTAVLSFNKKKNEWGWKTIAI